MALQTGHLFGNYRIVRLIGEGGFGEVYLAENPLIERRAAVKVLHTALAQDAELVRRFLNEARAASAIRHRNIIEVFDAGVTPEGAPYILMEFLEGVSLQKRLADRGRLALPQALEIARQAGSALAAAHAAGIVHRDLKPENLFLVPEAGSLGGERVKILDFGIAKMKRSGGTGGTMRTQAGLIMGSPAYMSPEQCKDSADVDLRSDIYSFGIIVYEMLAGRTPYVAASGTEMLIMHLTATPGPLRGLVANVPAHVEAAVKRALSRAREDRFESIAEFVGALRGDAGVATLSLPSPSGELPAFRVSGSERAVAAKSITTFSRATGEIGTETSDDMLPAARLGRRWPFFALGAVAVAGLAFFLLVRPSHDSLPARPSQGMVAVVDAGVGGPVVLPRQEPPKAMVVLPSIPDSGVTTLPVTGLRTGLRQPHPHHHPTVQISRPTPPSASGASGRSLPSPPSSPRKTETGIDIGF
jgi:serine/threonine protein kinase